MIPFLLKASFVLIVLLLFYKIFLEKESYFAKNRFYLLGSLVLVFTLPFITLPELIEDQGILSTAIEKHVVASKNSQPAEIIFQEKENSISYLEQSESSSNAVLPSAKSDKNISKAEKIAEPSPQQNQQKGKGFLFWISCIYIFGVVIFSLNFISQIFGMIYKIIRSDDKIEDLDCIIINSPKMTEPCSFFNFIFINPESYDYETYEQILAHEKIHVKKRHTFDLLLSEISVILLWFNPFIWIFRKELEKNIEYQTDDILLNGESVEKEIYQMNLLKVATFNQPLTVTTNYNQSLIKQRILKMNTKKSNIYGFWKYAFIAPLLFGILLFLNKPIMSYGQSELSTPTLSEKSDSENHQKNENAPHENLDKSLDQKTSNPEPSENQNIASSFSKNESSKRTDCENLLQAAKKMDEKTARKLLSNFDLACLNNVDKETQENFEYIKFLVSNEGEIVFDNYNNRLIIKGREIQLLTSNPDYVVKGGIANYIKSDCKEFYYALKIEDTEIIKDLLLNLETDCIENSNDPDQKENLEITKKILREGGDLNIATVKVFMDLNDLSKSEIDLGMMRKINSDQNTIGSSDCKSLIEAIRNKNIPQVKKLLKSVDPNCMDSNPGYAHEKSNGSNHYYRYSKTPLVAAARTGNSEIAELLIEAGAKVKFHSHDNESPLMAAAGYGDLDLVKYFLKKGADLNKITEGFGTALNGAARENHFDVAEFLIEQGANINAMNDGQGSALNAAARNGHSKMVKLLLEKGANIDAMNDGQGSALNAAARNGHNETAKLLIEKGADINSKNDGQGSALNAAARNGHNETVKLLIEKGADINAQNDGQGSALNAAARNGHNETVKLLIEKGANINRMNDGQGSPLNAAARNGNNETVKLLIDKGANINAMNDGQGSALMAASRNGLDKTVKLLIEGGANVNAINDGQGSALINATKNQHFSTAKLLLENGADPHLSRNHQNSPFEYARKKGFQNFIDLFKNYKN